MRSIYNPIVLLIIFCFISTPTILRADTEQEDTQLLIARNTFADGLYDLTIEQAQQFLAYYPTGLHIDEAHTLLGKAYFYKGEYTKALNNFESVLEFNDSKFKDDALYWCGEVNFKVAQYDSAISFYQRLIDKYPLSTYMPYAYYSRGWAYYKKNDMLQALPDFEKIIDKYPNSKILPSAIYKTAESYYDLSEFNKASEKVEYYLKRFPLASEVKDALFLRQRYFTNSRTIKRPLLHTRTL